MKGVGMVLKTRRSYQTKPKQYFLFNQETKEAFLANYRNPATRKAYEDVLAKIGFMETMYEKDLYNFNLQELKDTFTWYGFKSPAPYKRVKSIVGTYLDWAYSKKFISNPVDLSQFLFDEQVDTSINKIALEGQYLKDKEEVYYIAENFCVNKQDAVLFILTYFGIKGTQNDELCNLKIDDCDFVNNVITYKRNDGTIRIISIEQRAMDIIKEAIKETEYEKNNGRLDTDVTVTTYSVIPTEYVIRYAGNRNNLTDKVNPQLINQRIDKIAKMYGKPYLTPTTLLMSGLLHSLVVIEEKNGELTSADYKIVRERYGLVAERYHDTIALYQLFKENK